MVSLLLAGVVLIDVVAGGRVQVVAAGSAVVLVFPVSDLGRVHVTAAGYADGQVPGHVHLPVHVRLLKGQRKAVLI